MWDNIVLLRAIHINIFNKKVYCWSIGFFFLGKYMRVKDVEIERENRYGKKIHTCGIIVDMKTSSCVSFNILPSCITVWTLQ